ncbi:MAG: OadG family protein [Chloroflexi bacterium]|nr:OadG family protein [Chloroflexota bacterium]
MSDFTLSLQITALGMSLVFGAILLLWLMMVILTALTTDKEPSTEENPASDSPQPVPTPQADSKLQAALLAVAMALAEQSQVSAHALQEPPTAIVSAWQLGMRTRQMSEKGTFHRH